MKAGKYAEACPKLEAAQKLYSSAGILLNLGDCYEKIGRTASAWTRFGEAVSVATRSNRADDADEARRRQEALEPALVRLVIRVPSPVPGLVVTPRRRHARRRRSGERRCRSIPASTWCAPRRPATSRGRRRCRSPGAATRSRSRCPSSAPRATVDKLPPERIPDTPPKPPARRQPAAAGHGLAWGLLIGGVVVGAGGGGLMLVEAQRAGTARNKMDQTAYDATRTPWTIGLVGAIAGGVAGIAGVVLFAVGSSSSSDSNKADTTTAWIAPGPGGIQIGGTF